MLDWTLAELVFFIVSRTAPLSKIVFFVVLTSISMMTGGRRSAHAGEGGVGGWGGCDREDVDERKHCTGACMLSAFSFPSNIPCIESIYE